jgi:RHS repeat-associated protein
VYFEYFFDGYFDSAQGDHFVRLSGVEAPERDTALKALNHANTPTSTYFDSLGRAVLLKEVDENSNLFFTQSEIDIEGNLRSVTDARSNVVMAYKYDMLGNMVYQSSIDSGKRYLLHNSVGSPLRTWDERGYAISFSYDALHRPLQVAVVGGSDNLNNIVEQYIYGEGQTNDKLNNLRGNLYQHYDTGGLEQMATYDWHNKALSVERWLAQDYKNVVDWALPSQLEDKSYTISTAYDALGRIKLQNAPNNNMIIPAYSERGLLLSEDVYDNVNIATHLQNLQYNAKGQRTNVAYNNGTFTQYSYDDKTFRLKRLLTKNGSNGILQDLNYLYDAVGNITFKKDDNEPKLFYNNAVSQAKNEYTYDALYRLIEATGREKIASATFGSTDNWDDNAFITQHHINDNVAIQSYTQNYSYDAVGNILQLQQSASQGSYTRDYYYNSNNNQCYRTMVGSNVYNYSYHAQHGFLLGLPHLSLLNWNFKEEVCATSTQKVSNGDIPETTYYQYDSKGKRLRKITENFAPANTTPTQKNSRTYIEGYEYYEDFSSGEQTHSLSLIDQGQRFVMIEDSSVYGYLTRYQHPNHQSSCTLETDDTGNVITYEEYHPFGTTSYQATNQSITCKAKRYRYTGMERDDETGLNYHGGRYYIPWLCRWISADKTGIQDGFNVYAYCGNSPISHIDHTGFGTSGEPKVTTKNGQPFIDLGTKPGPAVDPASLRAATPVNGPISGNVLKKEPSVSAQSNPRAALPVASTSAGPMSGQPLPKEPVEQEPTVGNYYEGITQITGDSDLRAVTNDNMSGQAQTTYLGKPGDQFFIQQATDLLYGGGASLGFKSFGINTAGDISAGLFQNASNITISGDQSIKSFGAGNSRGGFLIGESNVSASFAFSKNFILPISASSESTSFKTQPMRNHDLTGAVTGTSQVYFFIKNTTASVFVGGFKSSVLAVESSTPVIGIPETRKIAEVTTRGATLGFVLPNGLSASIDFNTKNN